VKRDCQLEYTVINCTGYSDKPEQVQHKLCFGKRLPGSKRERCKKLYLFILQYINKPGQKDYLCNEQEKLQLSFSLATRTGCFADHRTVQTMGNGKILMDIRYAG